MKVLVVDAHLGTRQKVLDEIIIYAKQTEHSVEVSMASDGNQAYQMIATKTYDGIITSNQLRHNFGSNLLQAIWHNGGAPTLLHSSEAWGYRDLGNNQLRKIDLAAYVGGFDFARFEVKTEQMDYLRNFWLDLVSEKS